MTAPARLVPLWGGLTALLLGLGLAVLPARAQETVNTESTDFKALVEAGKVVLLPLGDSLKTPETMAVMGSDEAPPADDGTVAATGDAGDVAGVAEADAVPADEQADDQADDQTADGAAVNEPEVEVVEEETTEAVEPETVPESEAVTEVVPDEVIVDEPVEEIVVVEEIETPEPASLIDDEAEEQAAGLPEPSVVDLESEFETAAVDETPVVEEAVGEGSADFGDVDEPASETIVVEETVVDEVIVDPDTGEPAAEAIIVEETVIDEVTTVQPATDEGAVEAEPVEEPAVVEPEPEAVEVVADEPALEEVVVESVESEPPPEEQAASVVEPEPEEIVVAETVVEAPPTEEPAGDQAEALVGAMVPLRAAELGNAESIGPYRLWLASYKTVRQAKEGWQQIALANQDLLADLTPIIVLKDLGQDEGTFFRLQAGPLQSQGSASARCTALVDRNVYCSVLGP